MTSLIHLFCWNTKRRMCFNEPMLSVISACSHYNKPWCNKGGKGPPKDMFRDAIHTHFVTLIGKWTINFFLTHPVFLLALSRDMTKLLHFNLPTLPRLSARCLTHPLTIVHLSIRVTKWVWMASLKEELEHTKPQLLF